jgi:threonyl-tRNA synthetase
VDYQLPNRFELEYIGADNQRHRPVMIHRAPFGSLERFIAVLIEHTAGDFPLWLAPEQVTVLPIVEKYEEYAHEVVKFLKENGIRASADIRNEKIGKKIRESEMAKSNYMLVLGEKEMEDQTVSVRRRKEGDLGVMTQEAFLKHLQDAITAELA